MEKAIEIKKAPDAALCRSCGREILWIRNENGKAEPFDAKATRILVLPADVGESPFGERDTKAIVMKGRIGHFVTCPHADSHRRK